MFQTRRSGHDQRLLALTVAIPSPLPTRSPMRASPAPAARRPRRRRPRHPAAPAPAAAGWWR